MNGKRNSEPPYVGCYEKWLATFRIAVEIPAGKPLAD
jgi:hypothetical protein